MEHRKLHSAETPTPKMSYEDSVAQAQELIRMEQFASIDYAMKKKGAFILNETDWTADFKHLDYLYIQGRGNNFPPEIIIEPVGKYMLRFVLKDDGKFYSLVISKVPNVSVYSLIIENKEERYDPYYLTFTHYKAVGKIVAQGMEIKRRDEIRENMQNVISKFLAHSKK